MPFLVGAVGIALGLYFGSAVMVGVYRGWRKAMGGLNFPYVFVYSLKFDIDAKWADTGEILWIIPLVDPKTGAYMPYDENAWREINNKAGEKSNWYIPADKLPLNGFPEDEQLRAVYFKRYPELLAYFKKHGLQVERFKFDKKHGKSKQQTSTS